LAGQSNAGAMAHLQGLDSFSFRVADKLGDPDPIIDSTTQGGTAIYPDNAVPDWYPFEDQNPLTGELFDAMMSEISSLLSSNNAYLAGVLWVHGEADTAGRRDQFYEGNLKQLISRLNENFGNEFEFSLSALSDQYGDYEQSAGWRNVRNIQFGMDDYFSNVRVIDPYEAFLNKTGYQNFGFYSDHVHYTAFAREAILDSYLSGISIATNTYPI
jgi:hypothetical protein